MLRSDDLGDVRVDLEPVSSDSSTIDINVSGEIVGNELHIPSKDGVPNSFHTDSSGNSWWGSTSSSFDNDKSNTPAYILNDGSAKFNNVTIGNQIISVAVGENIQDAIDSLPSSGGTISLANGTHTIDYEIIGADKVSIIGTGQDSTILEFSSSANGITYTGTSGTQLTNFKLIDFTLQNSNNTAGIDIDYCDFWRIENIRVTSCSQKGIRIKRSQNYSMSNVRVDNSTGNGIELVKTTSAGRNQEFFTLSNCRADSNGGVGFKIDNGSTSRIINFTFISCSADSNTGDGFDISGTIVSLEGRFIGCISDSNTIGFDIDCTGLTLSGCSAGSNSDDGFENTQRTSYIGCEASGNTGAGFDIHKNGTILLGCNHTASLVTPPTDYVPENDVAVLSLNNLGGSTTTEKRFMWMKNTSGGTLTQGTAVVFKSVADGDEITTTTSQGDDKVFGMVLSGVVSGSINDDNYGYILTEGFTTKLKVDGTTDIAIGDYLGTFTTAGIAMKAAAGDMAFAIALEAYTTDDSSGIIDALLVSPRKI